MLTGRRAFDGEDVSETLAAVLRGEPEWSALPSGTPVSIRRLLRRCLVKDRRQRLGDLTAARLDIDEAMSAPVEDGLSALPPTSPVPVRSVWRRALPVGTALILCGPVAGLGVAAIIMRPEAPAVVSFTAEHPGTGVSGQPNLSEVTVSPDGRRIAYTVIAGPLSPSRLYVRDLAQATAERGVDIAPLR